MASDDTEELESEEDELLDDGDEEDGFGAVPPDPLDDPEVLVRDPTEDPFLPTRPPSIDDYDDFEDVHLEAIPPALNYPSWTSENSFVVSGPLGAFRFKGRRFETREQAESWAKRKYGFIYDRPHIFGRWCFRVPKPKAVAA